MAVGPTLTTYYAGVKGRAARLSFIVEDRPLYKETLGDSNLRATFAAQCMHAQEACRTVEPADVGQYHALLRACMLYRDNKG
jgi:hypothetical protein